LNEAFENIDVENFRMLIEHGLKAIKKKINKLGTNKVKILEELESFSQFYSLNPLPLN